MSEWANWRLRREILFIRSGGGKRDVVGNVTIGGQSSSGSPGNETTMSSSSRPVRESESIWHSLWRVFRIALDPRKLVLAAAGLALLWCGRWVIAQLPFGDGHVAVAPWNQLGPLPAWSTLLAGTAGWTSLFQTVLSAARQVLAPLEPLLEVVTLPWSREQSWPALARMWTELLWSLGVWSVFGGAIARLAALEFATKNRASLWSGFSFALKRFLSFFAAPLLPIAAILALWACCAIGGALGHIPYVGETIVALLWGLGFCAGLLIVLIAVATCGGWPLMIAGIATEASDGFDGFSRSFSYLYGRPWLFVRSVALAIVIGAVTTVVIEQATALVVMTTDRTASTFHQSDTGNVGRIMVTGVQITYRLAEATDLTGALVIAWHGVLFLLAAGFSASFFWSAATVIYFLVRLADDGTKLDEIWVDEPADEHDGIPLSGIAATGQLVSERSHHPTVGGGSTTEE